MKESKTYTLRRVRRLKIPKRSKGSDIFTILEVNPFLKREERRAVFREAKNLISASDGLTKRQRRHIHRMTYERIRDEWPALKVAHLTKSTRRQYRDRFANETEWAIFCSHVQHCRRAVNKDRRKLRGRQKQKSRRPTYETYINSSEWQEVKNRFYRKYGRKCGACGSVEKIHLHHMYYGNFGKEEDVDLVPLCEKHHSEYHARNGTQRDMVARTTKFIQEIKASQLLNASLV